MSKKTKIIIALALAVIVIAIIVYFVFIKNKQAADDSNPDSAAENSGVFPLKMGSKGKEVEQLQMYLLKQYGAQFPKFGVDGDWGTETDSNVQKFLKRDNVSQDVYTKWNLASFVTTKYK